MWKAEIILLLLTAGCFVLPFAVKALGYHEWAGDLFPFAAMAVPCVAGAGALTKRRSTNESEACPNQHAVIFGLPSSAPPGGANDQASVQRSSCLLIDSTTDPPVWSSRCQRAFEARLSRPLGISHVVTSAKRKTGVWNRFQAPDAWADTVRSGCLA
jgi:hypothetical protein